MKGDGEEKTQLHQQRNGKQCFLSSTGEGGERSYLSQSHELSWERAHSSSLLDNRSVCDCPREEGDQIVVPWHYYRASPGFSGSIASINFGVYSNVRKSAKRKLMEDTLYVDGALV